MYEKTLEDILKLNYGIESSSLEFLREGGTHTYIVNGKDKYLLKVIGSAFSDTARQSVSIMRYLEGNGFPVPETMLTKSGEAYFEAEAEGNIFLVDFDTVCRAPLMFDVMVMCDMTDYFNLKSEDIELTKEVYQKFLSGYSEYRALSSEEILSFSYWVAIRYFQLQATILEIYGIDCIDEGFIDGQLYWLNKWQEAMADFAECMVLVKP